MEIEVWKPIEGYEGVYEAGSLGHIRRVSKSRGTHGGILRPKKHNQGYTFCSLSLNNKKRHFLIHRLICKAFHENPDSRPDVNHKNAVRDDNRAENLEWATSKENTHHSLHVIKQNRKLSDEEILAIRTAYQFGARQSDLAEKYAVTQQHIGLIVHGKSWKSLHGPRAKKEDARKKLSDAEVISIREEYVNGRVRRDFLAKKYKVHLTTINGIVLGKSRADLPGPVIAPSQG